MANVQTYIPEVLDTHFDEAVFLYSEFVAEMKMMAETNTLYLARVVERLKANLDGLVLNEKVAWGYCENAKETDDTGEFFVASYLAFRSGELEKIRPLADASALSEDLLKSFANALAWHPWSLSSFWGTKFLQAKNIAMASVGIFCFDHHNKLPEITLDDLLKRSLGQVNLSATSLLLDIALKNKDESVLPTLKEFTSQELNAITFTVLNARLSLGDSNALIELKPFVLSENEHRETALNATFPLLEKSEAKQWVAELKGIPNTERWILLGIGAMNEKALLPWVVKQMECVELSRVAGKVFSQLTGIDLKQRQWLLSDDSIDQQWLEIEGDEELDWPDFSKIQQEMQSLRG